MEMNLLRKFVAVIVLCSLCVGCAPQVLIKDNKILSPKSYEFSTLGPSWESRINVNTYNFGDLSFHIDFISKHKSKDQYIFVSTAKWSTSMNKIRKKKRETFTGEDTIIKYFGEDVQELFEIKPEQIQNVTKGEVFGHNKIELEIANYINRSETDVPIKKDEECRVRLFVVGKGRRGNPFDAGYDFIVAGYSSNPANYSESISEFENFIKSFQMYD